jgi:hypothetical protein
MEKKDLSSQINIATRNCSAQKNNDKTVVILKKSFKTVQSWKQMPTRIC